MLFFGIVKASRCGYRHITHQLCDILFRGFSSDAQGEKGFKMSKWIDMEVQRPTDGERVITLRPFGMLVDSDTYTEDCGWQNHQYGYISHWMPIDPPGTYQEIMERPKGPMPDVVRRRPKEKPDWFPEAVIEHIKMMEQITTTQICLRFPGRKKDSSPTGDAVIEKD